MSSHVSGGNNRDRRKIHHQKQQTLRTAPIATTASINMASTAGGNPPSPPSPHVAMLAFPFGTHAAPLYALARTLAAAAPTVTFSFLTSSRSAATLPRDGATNLSVHAVSDGCPSPPPRDVVEQIGMFLGATPGNFREGMAGCGAPVSCVVSDAFLAAMAGEVAGEMGVPWVAVWTGGPAGLVAHLYTDLLRTTVGVGDQAILGRENELLHFLPGLSSVRVRDLPEGIVFGGIASGLPILLTRMAEALPSATAVVLNTFEGLDPDIDTCLSSNFKKSLLLGPFNLLSPSPAATSDPHGCLPWLQSQAPNTVAYISCGTVFALPPAELAELAHGLEESGVSFLWSLKEAMKEHLPAGFLERTRRRGLVVPWAPQVEALGQAAVGVFVTHCGWNSVIESLTNGVPMVCRPFFGDQKINARFVSIVWRIGVELEGGVITRKAVAGAMRLVLGEEEGKRMRAKAGELKAKAAVAVASGGSTQENLNSLLKIVGKQ